MYDTKNIDLTKLLDMCIQYDHYCGVFFDPIVTPVNAVQTPIIPESPAYATTNSFGWKSTGVIGSLFLILAMQSAVRTSAMNRSRRWSRVAATRGERTPAPEARVRVDRAAGSARRGRAGGSSAAGVVHIYICVYVCVVPAPQH